MRPRVEGMVWLPKDELDPNLIKHFRKELTIIPRKAWGYDDEPSQPIRCYQETPFEFGVPRSFWFGTVSRPYEYEWDVSFGRSWATPPECLLTHDGPYEEQGAIIDLFYDRFFRAQEGDEQETTERECGQLMGGIFQAATGFGKSDTTLGLINRLQLTTLIIVHKEFLQAQWVARAEKWLPGIKIGIVREDRCDFEGKHLVVAMAQSLALEDGNRYPPALYDWPGLLVVDECFPSNQRVITDNGPIPISEVEPGQLVANAAGVGAVARKMRREVPIERFVVVKTSRGRVLCTEEHPFLAEDGWVRARHLEPGDRLIDFNGCTDIMHRHGTPVRGMRKDGQGEVGQDGEVLLSPMLRSGEKEATGAMRGVWGGDSQKGEAWHRGGVAAQGEAWGSFLFDILSAEMVDKNIEVQGAASQAVIEYASVACQRPICSGRGIPEDEREQSDDVFGGEGEGVGGSQGEWSQAAGKRRERPADAYAAVSANGGPWGRMGFRAGGQDGGEEREWIPLSLQGGCCQSSTDDCDRSGWREPWFAQGSGSRQAQGQFFSCARVESVSAPEPEDFEGLERGSRGDSIAVYNLTVDGHPSYVLDNGVVVHNCHRISAPTWAPLPPRFSTAFRLGLTATPRRKDGADNVFWWHIGPIVYKATTETPKPKVRMIKTTPGVPSFVKRENVKAPLVVNVLVKLKNRNAMIVAEMMKALKAPAQRKLFVLSERLEHLRQLEGALQSAWQGEMGEWLATGFYTGEWFTGDVRPKLAPRTWKMKDGGRERAIETIYRSMARRWKGEGELKPCILTDKKTMEKSHSLILQWGDVAAIQGIVTDPDDDLEWVHVLLEDLEDQHLYEMASRFQIAQKKVEKKRRQTREELHEAERARVIFATFQMCSEGVDLPAIDTEFLVSPVADVEQAVGRVRRNCPPEPAKCAHFCPWRAGKCEGKPVPIVCDIVDLGIPLASKREGYRRDFYESLGTVVAG